MISTGSVCVAASTHDTVTLAVFMMLAQLLPGAAVYLSTIFRASGKDMFLVYFTFSIFFQYARLDIASN